MIALCTGMARSGSTWSFNVMRLIMIGGGLDVQSGYVGEQDRLDDFIRAFLAEKAESHSLLLKSHVPGDLARSLIQQGLAKSVCTYRDPRDCVVSRMRFQGIAFEPALDGVHGNLLMLDWLREHSDTLFVQYEAMMQDPHHAIQNIAVYLGATLNSNALDTIHQETCFKKSREHVEALPDKHDTVIAGRQIDNTTQLQTGHIGQGAIDGWRNTLSDEKVSKTHDRLAPWLERFGYRC